MGKGFNNYMCKKFFHPASRDNLKRVWMAEQKAESYKKKQEELRVQYEKEQDLYTNKAMLSKESKDKLSVNFMYEPPPGTKKEREREDDEPEYKFEWQRKFNAPREDYCKGDSEIRDQPFGIQVRNVRCIKCHKWGHINTDKECPMYNQSSSAEQTSTSIDPLLLVQQMREDGLAMKRSALGLHFPMQNSSEYREESEKLNDSEIDLLKSLSKKQKQKLLKKFREIEKGKSEKSKLKKSKRKHKNMDTSSDSSSSDTEEEKKAKKRKQRDNSPEGSSDESESEYLDLSQTHLHRLPGDVFGDVSRLRTLHLSGNKLTTLPDGLFKDLEILEDLYLDENQLLELPERLFAGLHTLKHLRVNDNRLSALPVLDACCDRMDYAFFHNNNVSAPSEAALRALLGDGSQRYVDLNNNPLRAASLRWLLRVHDALTAVAEDDCACGSVHRRKATVRLCVDAPCGARAPARDWVAAVRAAEEDGAGAEGGCEDGDDGCEGAAADASDEDEQAAAARRGVGGEDAAAGAAGAPEDGSHEEEDVAHAGHGARPASRASARTARAAVCSGILAYFVLTEWNFVIL